MRVALVTGSAQGIGLAIVKSLLAKGFKVFGIDVKDQNEQIDGYGKEFYNPLKFDLSDAEQCRKLVKEVGRIDVLVNNAAILIENELDDVTDDQFDEIVSTNLRAPFVLSVAASKGMKERKWGRIVNMSSVGARTGGISQSCVYAATKAGLIAVTKNFARNLGPYGITTNAVAPGAIATPMAVEQSLSDESLLKRVVEATPTGRLGTADEAAATVVFLASEEASFVNGVCLDVNGGWVMT
tara:strand:- start:102 stop:821 length:720 start_codon:yes stop_codon:yes gene_type:complete